MQPKEMKNLAAVSAKSKESSSREKRKSRVFLSRRTVRVKVKSKLISTSFLKIEGAVCGGKRAEKEGQLVELVSDQRQSAVPAAGRREVTAREAMEKSLHVRVIEEGQRRRPN